MDALVCRSYKILIASMLYAWVDNYDIGMRGTFRVTYPYDTVSISFRTELSHLYGKICGCKIYDVNWLLSSNLRHKLLDLFEVRSLKCCTLSILLHSMWRLNCNFIDMYLFLKNRYIQHSQYMFKANYTLSPRIICVRGVAAKVEYPRCK